MKLVKQNWRRLTVLLAAGLICATYLLAQTQTTLSPGDNQAPNNSTMQVSPPDAQETADSTQLIEDVNLGDYQSALEILHTYGVAEASLLNMASHMGKPTTRVSLNDLFLKASIAALAVTDRTVQTNIEASLGGAITTLGYERPVWMPRRPDVWATASYDSDIDQCPLPPIAVLNVRLNDPCFIRYFKLYDRYAESLHSVVLNGPNLSNAKLDETNFAQANLTLNALFQLIKARDTNAFVWLGVVNETDQSDEQWLRAMTFTPDGLQISNLRQFHSPFAATRNRYMSIVGTNMPMMVYGFYGYTAALQMYGAMLTNALETNNPQAVATATAQLGGVGDVVGQDLAMEETNLQALGYCGLSVHWLLLAALAKSTNAAPPDTADLLDPNAGLLDIYYGENNYTHVYSMAANMISNSVPGSMDWTVGKLYEGIALLSHTPPDTTDAITPLNQILAFNFTNKPGRDHYILGAVKWRIYAAHLSGDTTTPIQLVQWVQNHPFRADLKAAFLNTYSDLLTSSTTSP